tara:strand:- start:1020 stop:1136 length:117 start_codon:yes stop_codon:yes gene_type:complete
MQEKTAELQSKNQQQKLQREKDMLWNQTHSIAERRFIQ